GVADEANRTAHYKKKAQAYAAAQREGVLDDELSPEHLVFMIIGLAAWWISAPQLARMLTGADDSDPAEHARRRASVVRAAERRARPRRGRGELPRRPAAGKYCMQYCSKQLLGRCGRDGRL